MMENQATVLTKFEVVFSGQTMMETCSFHDAITYAFANNWDVYSPEMHCLIYDGLRDEFFI